LFEGPASGRLEVLFNASLRIGEGSMEEGVSKGFDAEPLVLRLGELSDWPTKETSFATVFD